MLLVISYNLSVISYKVKILKLIKYKLLILYKSKAIALNFSIKLSRYYLNPLLNIMTNNNFTY